MTAREDVLYDLAEFMLREEEAGSTTNNAMRGMNTASKHVTPTNPKAAPVNKTGSDGKLVKDGKIAQRINPKTKTQTTVNHNAKLNQNLATRNQLTKEKYNATIERSKKASYKSGAV